MFEKLEIIKNRYDELTNELTKEEVLTNFSMLKKLSKEHSDLEVIVNKYSELTKSMNEQDELKEMIKIPEYMEEATIELEEINAKIESLNKELEILLIPKDENDDKDVIFEIRGAAGGDEANIFAGDLFRMYSKYAEKNGWTIEINNEVLGSSGGYSQIEFMIHGENVYSKLKYESGTHRVQRVPETESGGRIHTSTATVLCMHELGDIDFEIKESDLKIDVFHSSGAGGQSVNTSNSAVRITHIPTNTVVNCQNERSQMKNKDKAMQILKAKIYEDMISKQENEFGNERKSKIGTGDRSEKIRTYNYPQNRVSDHRINYTVMDLEGVMNGHLDDIIDHLSEEDLKRKLEAN